MSLQSPIVFLDRLGKDYARPISAGLEHVDFFRRTRSGDRVFLKPNLTFPRYRPGVMTSIECLAATMRALVDAGLKVTVGEADSGGYNRFSMDEVFRSTGILDLARSHGVGIVNMSFAEPEVVETRAGRRRLRIPLPKVLLEECDAFISLPVPKVHVNTLVSLSIKNQWGCIQEPAERLRLHPYFGEAICAVCSALPPAFAVVDGRWGLNRSGPLAGDPVRMDFLMVGDDLVAVDRVLCRLMQIDENRVEYLDAFRRRGWWGPFDAIRLNADLSSFVGTPFSLRRKWTDLPGYLCFRNAALAWIGYRSPMAGLLHRLLYLFREPFYDYESESRRVRQRRG